MSNKYLIVFTVFLLSPILTSFSNAKTLRNSSIHHNIEDKSLSLESYQEHLGGIVEYINAVFDVDIVIETEEEIFVTIKSQ